jgi:gluconate 5-dehydrogenase
MGRLSNLFDLDGRTAVVTGGNSGIGLAIATALGLQGACVVLIGRNIANLASAEAALRTENIPVQTVAGDLADPKDVNRVVADVNMSNDAVDILVNAAGVNLRKPFAEVSAGDFDLHMALHLRAPFLLTQGFAPLMRERGWGRIINIASLQSTRAFSNSAPYGAAKGGIVQLTRAVAEEWSRHGITCNAIAPGFFPTPLTEPVFSDPQRAAANAAQTAIGRNGNLEDLYGTAVFLASEASAYVTGQTIHVDGGFTAK